MATSAKAKKKALITADERLEDLFTQTFGEIVSDIDNDITIDEFECKADKSVDGKDVTIDLRVTGTAGATTQDEICKKEGGKISDVKKPLDVIKVTLDDDSVAEFKLVDCKNLTPTDYLLVYQI